MRRDDRDKPVPVLHLVNDLAGFGAQRVVVDLVRALDRRRFRPMVASLELIPAGQPAEDCRVAGIEIHALRHADEPPWAGLFRLLSLTARLRPRILHTHLVAAGLAGRAAAALHRVPRVVATLHNLSDWEERSGLPLRRLDRATLGRCSAFLPVSDAVRRAFLARCPRWESRTVTVHSGIELAPFAGRRQRRAACRARLDLTEADFAVATVARLEPRKGVDTLLEAFALAAATRPELLLVVAGDGPQEECLHAAARARGLSRRIRWLGRVKDARDAIFAADAFALASRSEGLGLAVLEAMAAELPVVASDAGGLPELVEHGVSGLLAPPGSPGAWAEALVQLASHEPARERLAREGRRRAALFSLDRSARRVEAVYDDLLESIAAEELPWTA